MTQPPHRLPYLRRRGPWLQDMKLVLLVFVAAAMLLALAVIAEETVVPHTTNPPTPTGVDTAPSGPVRHYVPIVSVG